MKHSFYRPAVLLVFLGLVLAALPATTPPTRAAPNGPPPSNVQASECTYTNKVRVTWVGSAPFYRVWRSTLPATPGSVIVSSTPNSSLDDTTAVPNTAYYYWIQAYYPVGGWSGFGVPDKGIRKGPLPSPPADVQATDGTLEPNVEVTWTEDPGFDKYRVGRAPLHLWPPISYWVTGSSPYFDDTAVCSIHYQYAVKGRDLCSQWSNYSAPDTGYRKTTKPPGASNVSASNCTYPDKVRIDWDPAQCATYYRLLRHTTNIPITPKEEVYRGSATDFDDTGVDPGRRYYYWVYTCNDAGCTGRDFPHASGKACPPPANVEATDCDYPDKVRITWNSVLLAKKYQVFRGTSSGGAKTKIGEVVAPATSWDDASGEPGRSYLYWVKTCFDSGCTIVSDFSTSDPGRACPPPTGVAATDCTYPDKVRVTWNSVPNAKVYQIFRAASPGGAKTRIGEVTAPATSFDDTGATPDKTYHYWVKACFYSSCSLTSAFSKPDQGEACSTPPDTPTNVEATDCTYADKVRVTWNSVPTAVKYRVHRANSATGTKTVIGTVASPDTSYDDTSVTVDKTYHYWVQACLDAACTLVSGLSQADTGEACCEPPSAPSNVQASDGAYSDKVLVTWNSASGAGFYQVYRAESASGSKTKLDSPTGTWYADTSATPGTVYHYWVKACNACACSPVSAADDGFRAAEAEMPFRAYIPLVLH